MVYLQTHVQHLIHNTHCCGTPFKAALAFGNVELARQEDNDDSGRVFTRRPWRGVFAVFALLIDIGMPVDACVAAQACQNMYAFGRLAARCGRADWAREVSKLLRDRHLVTRFMEGFML